MDKCAKCLHSDVCKILESCYQHSKKRGIEVSITKCGHYLDTMTTRSNEPKNIASVLDDVGLGENNSSTAQPPNDSNIVEDGKYCPSCEQLREDKVFQGDICSKCGQEICEDCAITVEGNKILCEKCF